MSSFSFYGSELTKPSKKRVFKKLKRQLRRQRHHTKNNRRKQNQILTGEVEAISRNHRTIYFGEQKPQEFGKISHTK